MAKTTKHTFSIFYTLIKRRFSTNQSARRYRKVADNCVMHRIDESKPYKTNRCALEIKEVKYHLPQSQIPHLSVKPEQSGQCKTAN